MERNANFLTISTQRLEQEPHRSHPGRTHRLHLPLPHPEPDREGPAFLLRETSATSTGIPDNAIVGLTARLDIRRTPTHSLAVPMLLVELKMVKTLRMQHWNFSQWII